MDWNPPPLLATKVTLTAPVVVADPAEFAGRWLDSGAVAVVERHAEVRIVPFRDVAFDDATTYVHAFSETACSDVRAVRVADGWLVDAVREGEAQGIARQAWARAGRHLCLGKAVPGPGSGTIMQEARIRSYRLPVLIAIDSNACVEFIDYYAEDAATGDVRCFAHRVVAIRSLAHA